MSVEEVFKAAPGCQKVLMAMNANPTKKVRL